MTSKPASAGQDGLRVAIVGGGVIGLACAFELQGRGHAVSVFDPADPRQSTSWAAAGMIAPSYEFAMHGGEGDDALAALCFESAALWQDFAARLKERSGLPIGYDRSPALAIARTPSEFEAFSQFDRRLGAKTRIWSGEEARSLFDLSGAVIGAAELPSDHQVDNRRLLTALRQAIKKGGGEVVRSRIADRNDLPESFDAVVWARGTQEFGVTAPVKGQALALHPYTGGPSRVLRYGSGYIVPKPDRIIIGATSEETFADSRVSDRAVRDLLDEARSILPSLGRARISERWTGLRPKSADGRPVIGKRADGEFVAAAHFRNGILLAPVTARLIADQVEGSAATGPGAAFVPADAAAGTA